MTFGCPAGSVEAKRAAAKSLATRKKNRELHLEQQRDIEQRCAAEWGELERLKREVKELSSHVLPLQRLSQSMSGATLHREENIVSEAEAYSARCGVYFLIHEKRVVYVGQSTNVFGRIEDHRRTGKGFDSVSWVECPRDKLDVVESLYIHFLRPLLNGRPPLSLQEILALVAPVAHPAKR